MSISRNLQELLPPGKTNFLLTYGKNILDIFMIFFPSIGYFLQAYKFKTTKSSKGFSRMLCLVLLIAHILRIYFWIGNPFEVSLLCQSFVLIFSQIYLMHVFLQYQEDLYIPVNENKKIENNILSDFLNWKQTLNPMIIWYWTREIEYIKFIIFLFLLMFFLCKGYGFNHKYFINLLGTISVGCESVIAIPQIKENYKTKNAKNISAIMIFMWLGGDIFKTMYYIVYNSPIQMIFGGFAQVSLDLILSSQIVLYGDGAKYLSFWNKVDNKNSDKKMEEVKTLIREEEGNKNNFKMEGIKVKGSRKLNIINGDEDAVNLKKEKEELIYEDHENDH